MPEATNISQESSSPRSTGVLDGRNLPVFSARYSRMALLSNTTTPSSSMAGVFAFGLMARYCGVNCSPRRVSTGTTSYGTAASSRNSATLTGLGAG